MHSTALCFVVFFFLFTLLSLLMQHAQDVVQVAVVVVLGLKFGRAPPYAIYYKLELLLVRGTSHIDTRKNVLDVCFFPFLQTNTRTLKWHTK